MNRYIYELSLGTFLLGEEGGVLRQLDRAAEDASLEEPRETPILREAARQLEEYFQRKRKEFDLPFQVEGTDFQKRVWEALRSIPYGETISYKELARRVGSPKAYRAVGGANNRNPIMIVIPCHRVIGADGSLVGFGGGLDMKEKLLALEKDYV